MDLFKELTEGREKLCVVGLGYVGLPLAHALSNKMKVIGYDIDKVRINSYKNGKDVTKEIGDAALKSSRIYFTEDENDLKQAMVYIVTVPTPIHEDKTPDLSMLENACRTIGQQMNKGAIIIFESTVYPGVTEEVCVPILVKASGLEYQRDFGVGYSPERINPGDKVNTISNIVKIVSACNGQILEQVGKIYASITKGGIYPVSSIKVAEAAKLAENSQRDVNIAFANELAIMLEHLGIDTSEVLGAMDTKWNALGFRPGLVGGHCIGVDPYYFIYQAEKMGISSPLLSAGRKINDSMGLFVADRVIKNLILAGIRSSQARVAILGLTFKENCPDMRNSKVFDIITRLKQYGISPSVSDDVLEEVEGTLSLPFRLTTTNEITNINCLIVAVAHRKYRALSKCDIDRFFGDTPKNQRVVIDVKGILPKESLIKAGYTYWRL